MAQPKRKPGHTFPKFQAVTWTLVSLLWWYMAFRRKGRLEQGMETRTNVNQAWLLAAVTAFVALCWWGQLLYNWIKSKRAQADNGGNDNG